MRKIVVNASRDSFRRRRIDELLTDSLPEVTTGEMAALGQRPALIAALMKLPAGQRAIVVLRYWLDLTETETAGAVGCSVGNVKSQASRALAKLRLSTELADEVNHDHR